jgi:hypothetical protein
VDVILPMASPSHYTWSSYLIANPYFTLYKSSIAAKARLKKAQLAMYIQGFEMRVGPSGLSLPVYIAHQMQAVADAKIGGWIVWNAAQSYGPTWSALSLLASGQPLPGMAAARASVVHETKNGKTTVERKKPTSTAPAARTSGKETRA